MEEQNWRRHVPARKRWLLSGPMRWLGRSLGRLDAAQRELETQYLLEPIFYGPDWDAEKRCYRKIPHAHANQPRRKVRRIFKTGSVGSSCLPD